MTDIDKTEDGLIEAIKAVLPNTLTVQTLETDLTAEQTDKILALAPFVLIRSDGLDPVESERGAQNASGLRQSDFVLFIGAKSLRSLRESQVGCYAILNSLRALLDGKTVAIEGGASPELFLTAEGYQFTYQGLVVYQAVYSLFDY